MTDDADRFLESWQQKAAPLLDEALQFLAAQDAPPLADGVLADWVDQLRSLPFGDVHSGALIALIGKDDPHLQEAGLRLAAAASLRVSGLGELLEQPLARLLERDPVDPWVLRAAVRLLGCFIGPDDPPMTLAYRELVRVLDEAEAGDEGSESADEAPAGQADDAETGDAEPPHGIARNLFINPRREAIDLFEQIALQCIQPGDRELAILPVLEEHNETRGWHDTVVCLLERMGLDPDEHFAVLDG